MNMNPASILSVIDPSKGALSHALKPSFSPSTIASRGALLSVGALPGFNLAAKTFFKSGPNTAGLKKANSALIQMNGGGYDNTIQAQQFKHQVRQNGFSNSIGKPTMGSVPSGNVTNICRLSDYRSLQSPSALDDSLAGMM